MRDSDNSKTSPLFARRLPFLQFLQANDRMMLDHATSSFFPGLAHYHQMMTLAAAVAGVVIPVLHSQSSPLANPWFLRRAAICMAMTISTGVLIVAVSRWLHIGMMWALSGHLAQRSALLAEAPDDEEAVAEAVTRAESQSQPRMKRFRSMVRWGIIGDLLFYGSFLRGVVYLIEGFVKQ